MEEIEAGGKNGGIFLQHQKHNLKYHVSLLFGGEMPAAHDWKAFQHWHELLDALCDEQGYHDNMALAEALCAASGNQTQAAFDASVKNLQNWRQGVHIPQRRNFVLLGKVLKVHRYEGLREYWNRLYRDAKPMRNTSSPSEADMPEVKTRISKLQRSVVVAGVILIGVLGAAAFSLSPEEPAESPNPVAASEALVADYLPYVSLEVGETAIIHGARSRACSVAPRWEHIRDALPELATGMLSDGGVATRYSRRCNERVEVRAILFTATHVGTEQITLYGDAIEIHVSE